jgi:PBP1b-binding outer membrane lipoprotein LpoB
MKKILIIFLAIIILSACSTNKTPAKKSIYKDAIDKTKAIHENVDKQNKINQDIIK